jgi:hypothetical protein
MSLFVAGVFSERDTTRTRLGVLFEPFDFD